MTDTKLDPATLSAEERAIWDTLAINVSRDLSTGEDGPAWTDCYAMAQADLDELILARRALFAAPATSEPEKVVCSNCLKPVKMQSDHRIWSDSDPDLNSYICHRPKPAKVDRGTNCLDEIDDAPAPVARPIFADPDLGYDEPEPAATVHPPLTDGSYYRDSPGGQRDRVFPESAPVAASQEMPEAVRIAVLSLHTASAHYKAEAQPDAGHPIRVADALESFWREHVKQLVDDERYRKSIADRLGMNPADFHGVPALCDIETFVHEHSAQPVGMTPELDQLTRLLLAETEIWVDCARGIPGKRKWDQVRRLCLAVRAQFAQVKPAAEGKGGE